MNDISLIVEETSEQSSDAKIDYSKIAKLTTLFVNKKIFTLDQLNNEMEKLNALCHRWKIAEFAVFGSLLKEEFNQQSDIDCLVTFFDHANWDLFDIVALKRELKDLLNREIDLVERKSLSNPFIIKSIEESYQVLQRICSL
jgi:predicted nucleotidyltransferase